MIAQPRSQLEIAERWALELGNKIGRTGLTRSDGKTLSGVSIQHGPAALVAVEQEGVLAVFMHISIPPELRTTLSAFSPGLQEKMLSSVKQSLMESPRLAWELRPATLTRLGEMEQLLVSQLMRLDVNNLETFNRFADAIQELTTMLVKVQSVIATLTGAGQTASLEPGRPYADPKMYR